MPRVVGRMGGVVVLVAGWVVAVLATAAVLACVIVVFAFVAVAMARCVEGLGSSCRRRLSRRGFLCMQMFGRPMALVAEQSHQPRVNAHQRVES